MWWCGTIRKIGYSNAVLIDLLEEAGLPPGSLTLSTARASWCPMSPWPTGFRRAVIYRICPGVSRPVAKGGQCYPRSACLPTAGRRNRRQERRRRPPSADATAVRVALIRGAFEYQGQKCSAASRAYLPRTLWEQLKDELVTITESLTVGDVARHETFLGAVIDQAALQRLQRVIEEAQASDTHQVLAGGNVDDTTGWFVRPQSSKPRTRMP